VILYAFDVDHTLSVSAGPIALDSVRALREAGHITGLCGNWAVVTRTVQAWWDLFSFLGPLSMTKADFLRHLATYVPATEYVMVGNDGGGLSEDAGAAKEAGWRFISERDFAGGRR